jgi:hypothetical protein
VFLAVALPMLGALLASLQSVDLAYHIRAGGIILDTRAIPAIDTFTFTAAGLPWQDQQWGAEAILAVVYRAAGWTGLVLLRAILVGILFWLVFDTCRRGNTARTAALITLASFALAVVTLGLRPQLFGMVLFALTIWLIARRHERPGSLWLIVPVTIVWANVHGSFVLGPLALVLAAVEDAVSTTRPATTRTLVIAAVAIIGTLANPFGIGVWSYAVGIATNPVITNRISEWQPTTPLSPEGAAFYASVVLSLLLVVGVGRRRDGSVVASLVWLTPFAAIGVRTVRGLAWWPIVVAFTAARLLARGPDSPTRPERVEPPMMRRLNLIVAGALVVAGIALLPVWRPLDSGLDAPAGTVGTAPPGITAALREVVTADDRLFAPQPWGSWFEFAVPQGTVFIDSRIELFPEAVWDDYDLIVAGGADALLTLDRWGVTVVVDDGPAGSPLGERLELDTAWRQVYGDNDGRVFVRAERPG